MKIPASKLLDDLTNKTQKTLKETEALRQMPLEVLNYKPSSESWSALECIEHLARYSDFYVPAIEKAIQESNTSHQEMFKSGWFGNYFANSMLPKEKLNKMKTFKDKNPAGSELDLSSIDRFISQQNKTLELLEAAKKKNLNKIRIPVTVSRWIKLKLGDAFRVIIYHNLRHIAQAKRAINAQKESS